MQFCDVVIPTGRDNRAEIPENSGHRNTGIFSPKINFIFGPWDKTEFYVSGGYGAEVGTRTGIVPGLQTTLSVWILDLDSELVFDGDTAKSVPSRPSRRYGVELGNFCNPSPWLTIIALAHN